MKVLKFYTDSCMPCKVVGKILEKIKGIEVEPINAEEDTVMVDKYSIFRTPTLVFLEGNKEIGRISGVTTEAKIREIIGEGK